MSSSPLSRTASVKAAAAAIKSEEEMSYLQTHQTLVDALKENKFLKARLKLLGQRNQPAEWGCPVVVNPMSAGEISSSSTPSAEKIFEDLATAEHLLHNARKTKDSLLEEKTQVKQKIDDLMNTAPREIDQICSVNQMAHRLTIMRAQETFERILTDWAEEKTKLLSDSEKLSIQSHEQLHNASLHREKVDQQRNKMQQLAQELRQCLTTAKEMRCLLDDEKNKVALINILTSEIDANKNKSDQLIAQVNEQKLLLNAKKVSQAALNILDDQKNQIQELKEVLQKAEDIRDKAEYERNKLEKEEKRLSEALDNATELFKKTQTRAMVLDSDIEQLKAELERSLNAAKAEDKKNVQLNKTLREEKIMAADSFIERNITTIHRPEKVWNSLVQVKDNLEGRPATASKVNYRAQQNQKRHIRIQRTERPQTGMMTSRRKGTSY